MSGKAAVLLLELQEGTGIAHRRLDLQTIAHDARILQQPLDVTLAKARDALGIETGKRGAIAFALVQDRRPRKARLRALQDQELELLALIPHRHSPLGVVIGEIELVALQSPVTTDRRACCHGFAETVDLRAWGA